MKCDYSPPLLTLLAVGTLLPLLASPGTAQPAPESQAYLRLTALDPAGNPVNKLTLDELTLRLNGDELQALSIQPIAPTTQIVAIFEGLAVTQRQLNGAIGQFIGSLDDTSTLDMQSVDGNLDAAIIEAIDDLHARGARRPVIVLMGQPSEMAPSALQSSQVRGRRRATDLSGDIDALGQLLTDHSILFYGVSITDAELPQLQALAAHTGGRFERLPDATRLNAVVSSIALELSTQHLISYMPTESTDTFPNVELARPGLVIRTAPAKLTH